MYRCFGTPFLGQRHLTYLLRQNLPRNLKVSVTPFPSLPCSSGQACDGITARRKVLKDAEFEENPAEESGSRGGRYAPWEELSVSVALAQAFWVLHGACRGFRLWSPGLARQQWWLLGTSSRAPSGALFQLCSL